MKTLVTHNNQLCLSTIAVPLMLQVKLPVDRMFAMGVENKATGDSQLNDSPVFKTTSFKTALHEVKDAYLREVFISQYFLNVPLVSAIYTAKQPVGFDETSHRDHIMYLS